MAVTFNMDNFFSTVLTSPLVKSKLDALVQGGVTFKVELYCIKAHKDGSAWTLNLPITTSSLIKAGDAAPGVAQAKNMINGFIEQLFELHGQIMLSAATGGYVGKAPELAPDVYADFAKAAKAKKPGAKKSVTETMNYGGTVTGTTKASMSSESPNLQQIPKVIPLVEAQALGQKVRGTSASSVYRLIAANPRVKLAARLAGAGLSLRVECIDPTPEDVNKIKQSGMSWHATGKAYGSLHMDLGGVSPQRAVGAFLFGLGIKFDQVVNVGEEMEIEGE